MAKSAYDEPQLALILNDLLLLIVLAAPSLSHSPISLCCWTCPCKQLE